MAAEFTPTVLSIVHSRSGLVCEMCGKSNAEEHHHRRPRGQGSTKRADSATASACLHVCRHCHRLAEAERNLATVCGWLVPQNESPADNPVIYRGFRVRLDDAGSMEAAG
jgi:hypothetical protein